MSKDMINGNGKRSYKLMIVDDSNLMRRRIERSQQFEELELVGTAADGVQALELFKRTDPDVVTMDITMPHMDGIECIARLVEMKPAIRILVVSALADKATAVEAMERGANGFLNKPFTDRQLNEAIAELIR
ncbi:MAG TPA: response regulator [Steroidobacteraceae bacterium]|jgi:two-component system chemotaxis response regulator CheY|nr:response regulator [Steroidobacteraceae bacterium]